MWLIPGKTKLNIEIFKGVGLADMFIGLIAAGIIAFVLLSEIPGRFIISAVILVITIVLLLRTLDQPNYRVILHMIQHFAYPTRYRKNILTPDEDLETGNPFEAEEMSEDEEIPEEEPETMEDLEKIIAAGVNETLEEEELPGRKKEKKAAKKAAKKAEKKIKKVRKKKHGKARSMRDLMPFTDIMDDIISFDNKYYGAVLEIPCVEFRLFSASRKNMTISNGLGRVLRNLNSEYSANIVKIERPVHYESYRENEYARLYDLRKAYENGFLSEEEFKIRVEVVYDRIGEIEHLINDDKIIVPFYYLVLYDSDMKRLDRETDDAIETLRTADMKPRRLESKELAVFLKYTNEYDFDESEIDDISQEEYADWAMPEDVEMHYRTTDVNGLITHVQKVISYPVLANDAWLATVMTMPGTKVVVKCKPMDLSKSIRNIDRSLAELQAQYATTSVESKRLELEQHIQSLGELLVTLQGDNEVLLSTNIYVTAYDYNATQDSPKHEAPESSTLPRIANMKRQVRRVYNDNGLKIMGDYFRQVKLFIASQISGYDPFEKEGRGIPGNSVAASYPWVFANVSDDNGIHIGSNDGVPVFIDFFRRDSERVNSNMVIVGKSGSGKSYATKSLLTNLAADNSKIFILDPENEYSELADNMHGKFINVGNAQYGRLNPFQIMTALDDDESDGETVSGSYATHLQFLEEFFKQILPDCDKDALEYLNSIIDRMYMDKGITGETDLRKLRPTDYPYFDDLYDAILQEFQQTDNEYIRSMLRILMNYISKFSAGGRNANIWNGPSTVTTEENFCVFNFQSLLANRNSTIANAQMLLVLKYIDNEIIKNRDYNTKFGVNRKIVVVIDEAHVFIDTKFPVALDFMFQLAKRIRKYNGMQIVITQNIKDFVGSEEIARKSTAIINACQYSFIFSLAPNDMDDLCKLYEKAGGINETEQERIVSAPRGQAFTVVSPSERTTFRIDVPQNFADIFEHREHVSAYFDGEEGQGYWDKLLGESRQLHEDNVIERVAQEEEEELADSVKSYVNFEEISEEDLKDFEDISEIPEIPEDPEEFRKMQEAQQEIEEEAAPGPVTAPATDPVLLKILDSLSSENVDLKVQKAVSEALASMKLAQAAVPAAAVTFAAAPAGVIAADEPEETSVEDDSDELDDLLDEFDSEDESEENESDEFDSGDDESEFDFDEDESGEEESGEDESELDFGEDESEEEDEEEDEEDELFDDFDFSEDENSSDDDEDSADDLLLGEISDDEESDDEDDSDSDDDFFDFDEDEINFEDDDDDDDDGDSVDILSLLAAEAEAMDDVSSIEQMEMYEETVLDITLDDLKLYVRNQHKA